jgi:hypothetical protein
MDPIGVDGGMNQYGYGFGDPINSADLSGLNPKGPPGIPWWVWWGLSKMQAETLSSYTYRG